MKNGINFESLIHGGHQEANKRAGTESVASIVGMGKAIEIANSEIKSYNKKLKELSNNFKRLISKQIPNIKFNGHEFNRLQGNVNMSFDGIDSEALVLLLSTNRIYTSGGSACNSGQKTPSHVITAIGVEDNLINGTLRVTFGRENQKEDIEYIANCIASNVGKLKNTNK